MSKKKEKDPTFSTRANVPQVPTSITTRGRSVPSTSNTISTEGSSTQLQQQVPSSAKKNSSSSSSEYEESETNLNKDILSLNPILFEEDLKAKAITLDLILLEEEVNIEVNCEEKEKIIKMECKMNVILNATNYREWASKMKAYLHIKELWVNPGVPFGQQAEADKTKSTKAYDHIVLNIDSTNEELIRFSTNSVDAWNTLKDSHKSKSMSSLILTMTNIMTLRIKPEESMQVHLNRFTAEFNKLREHTPLSEEIKIAMLLASVTGAGYESLVTGFMAWSKEKLTLEGVKNAMNEAYIHKQMAVSVPAVAHQVRAARADEYQPQRPIRDRFVST